MNNQEETKEAPVTQTAKGREGAIVKQRAGLIVLSLEAALVDARALTEADFPSNATRRLTRSIRNASRAVVDLKAIREDIKSQGQDPRFLQD